MDLIIKIPLLFDKNMNVDYLELERLLSLDESIKGLILFSQDFEGNTLTLKEKKEIFLKVREMTDLPLIYEITNLVLEEEINLINEINPDYLIFPLVNDNKLSSKGFEKYIIKTLKKVKTKALIHFKDSFENCKISYKSFFNIARFSTNFYGIYDETSDCYFSKKIVNLKGIKIYTPLNKYIDHPNKNIISGIINDFYLVFPKEITQYFYESNYGFINPVLINYLKFIEECIDYYPRSMAIKYLLSKKGYKSYYSKLPYYILKGEEKDKLDFIF